MQASSHDFEISRINRYICENGNSVKKTSFLFDLASFIFVSLLSSYDNLKLLQLISIKLADLTICYLLFTNHYPISTFHYPVIFMPIEQCTTI